MDAKVITIEPDMIKENGITVLKPTVRFPVGNYVLAGPDFGVLLPGMVMGVRGAKMREETQRAMEIYDKMNTIQAGLGQPGIDADGLESQLKKFKEILDELGVVFDSALREMILINYADKTKENQAWIADWFIENIALDLAFAVKVMRTYSGENVDGDSFRNKRDEA